MLVEFLLYMIYLWEVFPGKKAWLRLNCPAGYPTRVLKIYGYGMIICSCSLWHCPLSFLPIWHFQKHFTAGCSGYCLYARSTIVTRAKRFPGQGLPASRTGTCWLLRLCTCKMKFRDLQLGFSSAVHSSGWIFVLLDFGLPETFLILEFLVLFLCVCVNS